MKFIIALALIIGSTLTINSIQAGEIDCRDRLTNGYQRDFVHLSYHRDDLVAPDYGKDHLAQAIAWIRYVLEKDFSCTRADVNFGRGPMGRSKNRCNTVAPGVDSSRVCYVETNLGYFFVHVDFTDNVSFQYHRWD